MLSCPLAHLHQGDRGHHTITGVSVRVLSEVCAEVFEVLISSLLGWVVKLNGGTACLSEGTALPRIPSTAGPGTLSWAVSSQRLRRLRANTAPHAHTPTYSHTHTHTPAQAVSHTCTCAHTQTKGPVDGFQWLFIKCKISLAQIKNQTPPSSFNFTGWKKQQKTIKSNQIPETESQSLWNPTFRIANPQGWAEGWGKNCTPPDPFTGAGSQEILCKRKL